jgi:hypothetical protein
MMIGQNVLRAGLLAVVMTAAAAGAMAAPFSLLREGEDKAWVVDGAGGTVAFCELVEKRGPKVIDVFGNEGQPRPDRERGAEPVCTDVLDSGDGFDAGRVSVFAVPAFRQIVNHRFYGREVELQPAPLRIVTVARPIPAGTIDFGGGFGGY